jgi:hypothetical protein
MIVVEAAVPQVATETTEIPGVTPVQDRSSPRGSGSWERGLLMLEHVQWIIDQLQDDLNIINMERLPTDNPDEIQTGPSDPEFIDLDEITGLDDPEFTTATGWITNKNFGSARDCRSTWEDLRQTLK